MPQQNFKNHSRYIPLWHMVTSLLLLALLGGSIVNFMHADAHTHYSAALILLGAIILLIIYWYARWFALRAQDRAIRAEEQLRHYVMTGKLLDSRLKIRQIIGLRFASDAELVTLAQRAAEQGLSEDAIKKEVKRWRADTYRV